MRLLVTRPQPDAQRTAERLQALGHSPVVEPLLTSVATAPPQFVERPGAIAVTSRNALRALRDWPQVANWRGSVALYAVGDATAALAREIGFADVRSAGGAVDDLARMIVEDREGRGGAVLYVAADVRRADLGGALSRAGLAVRLVEAYRMESVRALSETARRGLEEGVLDGGLFYSERTAAVFASLVGGRSAGLPAMTAFVLSAAVAQPLANLGFGRVAIAPHPSEDALLEVVGRA